MRKVMFVFLFLLVVVAGYTAYGLLKPLPEGVSFEGREHTVSNVEFLYDLTYEKEGEVVSERRIFDRVIKIVDEAEEFIVFDMFLFNSQYDSEKDYPGITEKITEALRDKKQEHPSMPITFITDQINTVYGSYKPEHFQELRKAGVDVIETNLTPLRDANPLYSGFWRAFLKNFGREGEARMTNPFNDDGPEVTLRSYFKMFNLKGNHRKVLATEKEAMITSANPHDASGYNSDIAFVVQGGIIEDLLESEQAVANFSGGYQLASPKNVQASGLVEEEQQMKVQLLTEGKIRMNLLEEIRKTNIGDSINLGMFFLSERDVVDEIVKAGRRGVRVQLILDPNETIFGTDNIGIPNRPVAKEMLDKNLETIDVRFYHTHDEQYHAKLILIEKAKESVVIGGSANFTRRNLNDYNLDTSLKVVAPNDHPFVQEVNEYFSRLWNNETGIYTVAASEYIEDYPKYKMALFRLQKMTRLTTF
ncbi:phospholipase [Anaerobacillus alkaliphilus]|uniref:phospholipase D n=1 Tax=Anaerobacillus alkaliphilus TaxID=1548597 RepID=A0A4Q0VNG0_9BACI|nr:phospholipase D family protein [Anaerobacillus alkaliphilus]RXI96693.1 phospholipase [Anaerobacillus alkaliphilus]